MTNDPDPKNWLISSNVLISSTFPKIRVTCFQMGMFPTSYVPTVFSTTSHELSVDGREFELTLWDTAGQEDYIWLGPASYQKADVVLICFSIDSPTSLENVELKWAKKIKHFCKNAPIILVGNKIDLCTDQEIIKRLDEEQIVSFTICPSDAV